jgi:HEAT repeat protein
VRTTIGRVILLVSSIASRSSAQGVAPPESLALHAPSLREHFGIDLATRLLRSDDSEERLRGLERAAAIGTPEAVSLLIHAAREPSRPQDPDTRALLAIVRGLADATSQSEVRSFLRDGILGGALHPRAATPAEPESQYGERSARLALARSVAALALATSPDPRAVEAVVQVARDPGPGQAPAIEALVAFPPQQVAALSTGPMSPALLRLAGAMGDLRTLDAVRAALHATDAGTRTAALDAVADMGDGRAIPEARGMVQDPDGGVRAAAARALVRLDAPDRLRIVEGLIANDETTLEGVRLAAITCDAGVVKALAARVLADGERDVRGLAVVALGRCEAGEAVQALAELIKDPTLAGDAAAALARSPMPTAPAAIESLLRASATRRLGARAYVYRAFTRGEDHEWGRAALLAMAGSADARDRAVGRGGLVLLGKRDALDMLLDPDAGVRRAVAVAAMADLRPKTRRDVLQLCRTEPDPVVRKVEMAALTGGDAGALVPTVILADRAIRGEADGPLATMALAARADPADRDRVDALLASSDPIARAHAARGLGESPEADATGRLADAYTSELDPLVRRAIARALARRQRDADAPLRASLLEKAARIDPDPEVRDVAARARRGLLSEDVRQPRMELAWMRLATAAGTAPPWDTKADPSSGTAGMLVRSDGVAVPVSFDSDGYALVPIPPGQARLLLEPRLPAYERAEHE